MKSQVHVPIYRWHIGIYVVLILPQYIRQENTCTIAFFRLFLLFDLCIKYRVILVADSNSIYFTAQIYLMFRCKYNIDIVHRYCWFLRGPRSPRKNKKARLKPDEMRKIRLAHELAWFLRRIIGRLGKNMTSTCLFEMESRLHALRTC